MKGKERVGIQAKIDIERGGYCFQKWAFKYYHADCVSEGTKRKLFLEDQGKLSPKMRLELERDLREVRRCFAQLQGCEAYKVFPNQSLHELVTKCPQNQAQLLKCYGIGKKRAAQYGSTILATIRNCLAGWKATTQRATTQRRTHNVSSTAASASSAAAQAHGGAVDDDDDDIILVGPTLSVEELVRKRMEEVRARGEEFEILD